MKKLVIMILCMVLLTGCGNRADSQEQDTKTQESNMFVYIQPTVLDDYYVVYHKDTKVMYAVSAGYYNRGNFTLLVNPDGTPMLYEADEEE